MEERPAGSGAADSPASAETASSRRRAGGLKRKSNALSSSTSTPTSSKRLTREKAAISLPPIHNGPLTRARQSPSNFAATSTAAAAEEKISVMEVAAVAAEEERRSKLEELEAAIEAEFEGIRSRDSNAHVVPSHCGWFSWMKVHPLEERVLPSFFNEKSQSRTPDIYMEIRNWIVRKFHANPNAQIELKDLSELEVGDLDARQEVLEFLDYWGLINFHPFPEMDSVSNGNSDEAGKDKLLKSLFCFEEAQQSSSVFPKPSVQTPAVPSGIFPDSSIAEELVKQEGVEYHCNSCSADCSRKRYHCQKQADYDLCADCFNNGKFGSNMSSSDFILMEPAEAPSASGGKWTDQETLLLLEALELYKENWNEIAEHVATKTKAQCILHFVQMPIEDVFFDGDNDMDSSSKETVDPTTAIDGVSTSKDGPESGEAKIDGKDDQLEASKPEDASEVQPSQEALKPDSVSEAAISEEKLKSKDTNEAKPSQEMSENVALKALTEAFEAVGYSPTSENGLSFAEVGNPVMALAAFLGRLVGPEVATASARNSLKSLSCSSPGLQLATRHCFLLEDPPDDGKERVASDCTTTSSADEDSKKDNQENENQKGNNSSSVLDSTNAPSDDSNKKNEDSIPGEHKLLNESSSKRTIIENESGTTVTLEEVEPVGVKRSSTSKDHALNTENESDDTSAKPECPQNFEEACREPSQLTEAVKDVEMGSNLKPSEKNEPSQSATPMSVDEPSQVVEALNGTEMVSDFLPSEKNEPQQLAKSDLAKDYPEESKAVDMLSEKDKSEQPVPNPNIENGPTTDTEEKNGNKERPDEKETKNNHNIDKLKRGAVSALSAAAVKARLLANQEEDQIRQLAASLIEKQLHKLEVKFAFFNEMEAVIMRVKEQLDRSRQKLYHERAQIIAARLGLPGSSSRAMPPSLPNRIAMNFANSMPRPPMGMTAQRPPMSRPMGTMAPAPAPASPNTFVSSTTTSVRPSGQDQISSVGMK